jgi:cell division protein FtsL
MILEIWNRLGWQLKAIVSLLILIVLLVGGGLIWHSCTKNSLEREIQREKQARSDEQQTDIDETKVEVNQSSNVANQSKANTQKIENANFANTNLSEAQRLRCKAFNRGC